MSGLPNLYLNQLHKRKFKPSQRVLSEPSVIEMPHLCERHRGGTTKRANQHILMVIRCRRRKREFGWGQRDLCRRVVF